MKRLIALILALSTVVFAVACSGDADADKSGETTPAAASIEADESDNAVESAAPETEDAGVTLAYPDFVPVVRFAVASDVHIKDAAGAEDKRLAKLFEYSYAYADSQEYSALDAVIFAGDLTDDGKENQFAAFKKIVDDHIREDTRLICTLGNHDLPRGSSALFEQTLGLTPDTHEVINGFHFIGVSPTSNHQDTYTVKYPWLREQLDAAVADKPDYPVFVFQHHPVKDTVWYSDYWNTGMLASVYKNYVNIVDFAGHSHAALNHPGSVYQREYTMLGTCSLSYFGLGFPSNAGTIPAQKSETAQFYIIEADAEGRVLVRPFNLITGEFCSAAIKNEPDMTLAVLIEAPADKDSFAYTDARADTTAAPYFEQTAEITVNAAGGGVRLTFPRAVDDECVYSYYVKVTGGGAERSAEFSSNFYIEPLPEKYYVSFDGLPKATELTAEVYATDCFGKTCETPLTLKFTT